MFAFASDGGGGGLGLTERMMHLVIQIGVILFAARVGNMAFEKCRMPGVLGELCIGILIGPSLLGGLSIPWMPGFERGLFYVHDLIQVEGTSVSPELYGFCSVAAVVLLFLVGLETDLKLFARFALAGTLVGLGGVVFSFAAGALTGMWLLPMLRPGTYGFLDPGCIFLGVMSTATSVSITARILSERKKLDTPEGSTILAGAVLDDVLGIVMLAIGMGVIGSAGAAGVSEEIQWGQIGMIAVKSIGIWLGATVFGVVAGRHIGTGLKALGGHNEMAIMALGLAMIVAGLFEEAHLAMIIGAYVMGLSLSRTDISYVVRDAMHPIFAFLVPLFFTVMGMMVDITQFMNPKVLLFGVFYTVVAVLAKLIGCGLPTLFCGFNLRGALRVGLGMVPRGEVALIVAGIGLASGFLTSEVFGVAIFMTLMTTVIPPPFLVRAFRSAQSGLRDSSKEVAHLPLMIYAFPTPQVAQLMLSHLLDAIRREGFFVHRLDPGKGIYQVRKEAMVIGITFQKDRIEFEVDRHEVEFVKTAMSEVMAEIEETLKALRHPLDADGILKQESLKGPQDPQGAADKMIRYLKPETVTTTLKGKTMEAVIAELIDLLVAAGHLTDHQSALDAVLKREAAMSTGLKDGLACPHARTPAVQGLVCAVGVKSDGIDFHSADGKPSRIFTLVLCPEDATSPYLEFMAGVRAVFDECGRAAALEAKTAGSLYRALTARRGTTAATGKSIGS
jgi:Kef-type K+ transport system membrane component KefB/mannitol/fructose-specific phosphotransferase system IIA component (Ntr-type)